MARKISRFPKLKKHRKKEETTAYQYDYEEYNEDPRQVILQKRKAKRRLLYKRIATVVVIIALIVGYFLSDLSKVHSITISGNKIVSTEAIQKAITVDEHSFFLLVSSSSIKKEVENVNLVKSAEVKRNLFGGFDITITENEPIAFTTLKNKTYIIDEEGDVAQINESVKIKKLKELPKLANFKTLKLVEEFAKQYVQVPELIRNSISDIVYAPLKADETRVRLILTNSKELIVRIEDMADNLSNENFNFEGYMDKYKNYRYFIFEGHYIRMSKDSPN